MKQFGKKFLKLSVLLVIGALQSLQAASCDTTCDLSLASCASDCVSSATVNNCDSCHTVYIPRSAHSNTAYFWLPFRHDMDCQFNGTVEVGYEYQRSFKNKDIANCMFGSDVLHFQGSQVHSDPNALIADYFGLSPKFDGAIRFTPRIQNHNIHFQSRFGFDNWARGLYGQVNFTFSHQKRSLLKNQICGVGSDCSATCNASDCCSNICNFASCASGLDACAITYTNVVNNFPPGYMDDGRSPNSFSSVLEIQDLQTALEGQTPFGDMQEPWRWGRFKFCDQTKNAVAGLSLIAGWNFLQNDCGHLGLFLQYIAPTGNKPDARYVFSPVVGNGKHHEIGGGLTSHYDLWKGDCGSTISMYLDGYVTTMIKNCQVRSFDFAGKGCLSRYMLLKALDPLPINTAVATVSSINGGTGYMYAGTLLNGINYATRLANVSVAVKGDATLRFLYNRGGFSAGLGWNVYGQSKEKVKISPKMPICDGFFINANQSYGFKGCQGVACYAYTVAGGVITATSPTPNTANTAFRISNATASDATIKSCGTIDNSTNNTVTAGSTSLCADWKTLVVEPSNSPAFPGTFTQLPANRLVQTGGVNPSAVSVTDPGIVVGQYSVPAVALVNPGAGDGSCDSSCDVSAGALNLNSGEAPKQFTNKAFLTLDYKWEECSYAPYLGFGSEVEGGSNCSLKQWGIWLKGGINF